MTRQHLPNGYSNNPALYEFRIGSELDARQAHRFDGLTITIETGETRLYGPVIDQAALHGVIRKVRDLGAPLNSVTRIHADPLTFNQAQAISAKQLTSLWLVPSLLLALGALNILAGTFQISLIAEGPTAENLSGDFASPHYFKTPLPILIHLTSGIAFNLLGPFQFAAPLRKRWPLWHRWSGRLLVVSGMLVAGSALWMNQFFPAFGTRLKFTAVLIFSIGMLLSLAFGLRAIRQRNIASHRAWMMRAIAIGLAPAVQRLFLLPLFLVLGDIHILLIELTVWMSFVFNLAVVEWYLHRERRPSSVITSVEVTS